MNQHYIEDAVFEKADFSDQGFTAGDYEGCRFINCDFSGVDLSHTNFIDCLFDTCNVSRAKLTETTFRDVVFTKCKIYGTFFDDCNHFLFTVKFNHCVLTLSSFFKLNLKTCSFQSCNLQECDFTEADAKTVVFDHCDFLEAKFDHTHLEKADLRTAYNYSIDPENNNIKKARFAAAGVIGLLDKYEIIIEEP